MASSTDFSFFSAFPSGKHRGAKGRFVSLINVDEFVHEVRKELRTGADKVSRIFGSTVENWEEQPKFEQNIEVSGNTASFRVFTFNKIYFFLNYGTSERFALMHRDFVPMTRVRVFGNRGRSGDPKDGKPILRGRKAFEKQRLQPKIIEAREWDSEIQDRFKREFADNMEHAFVRGMAKVRKA